MAGPPHKKVIIPRGTLDPDEHNVIEIPEACEESKILIAQLSQQLKKPKGFYPPPSNPYNRIERRVGGNVQFGMPPLSPVSEESSGYSASLDLYGHNETYGTFATSGSSAHSSYATALSGQMKYCPASTPISSPVGRAQPAFPPGGSSCRTPSLDSSAYSYSSASPSPIARPQPVLPAAGSPCRTASLNSSAYSFSSASPSPVRSAAPPPRRVSPPRRAPSPPRRPPSPDRDEDMSYSMSDISQLCSFDEGRGYPSQDSPRGRTPPCGGPRNMQNTPPPLTASIPDLPEEMSILRTTLDNMDQQELEEMREVQFRIKKFQKSRRGLFYTVMKIEGIELPLPTL